MVGWSNARFAIEEWGDILDLYSMYDNAYDGWMTEAQFMDWVAERRQGRNTRVVICPRAGRSQRVSTKLLSRDFREANFPEYRIGQVGEGPNVATADHPSFQDFATHCRELGAPGGFHVLP